MKIKLLFTILLLLVFRNCFGQIMFQKVISADSGITANAVQQTSDGGYMIVGNYHGSNAGGNHLYLIKTNAEGDTLWTKIFGGILGGNGLSVQQTTDGGFIAVGESTNIGIDANLYVIKTDSNGDTLWTKTYGGTSLDYASFVQQTNDSGYIIAGSTNSFGAGGEDVYLLKINLIGDIIWTKTYGGSGDEEGNCVKQTSDSGYIICGSTTDFGAGVYDVYLIKTDANGDTLWTKTYGGAGEENGYSIQQTTDGGYIINGYTSSFGAGNSDVYLIKTDVNGDTLWTKTYGGNLNDGGNDVHQTSDSGYIICGYTWNFGAGLPDVYLIKTNINGDTLWTKAFGGSNPDVGYSVRQTNDGGYIIAGTTISFDSLQGFKEVYLIKTDAYGNGGCYQSTTNTIVGSTRTIVGRPHTIVSSGGIASSTSTIIISGGNDSTLCLTTGINEQSINNIISIFPNPTTDQLTITGNWKENDKMKLTIMNILGETIYGEAINSKEETVNCKLFPSGIYFVQVADEKDSWVAKFVKE